MATRVFPPRGQYGRGRKGAKSADALIDILADALCHAGVFLLQIRRDA